MSHGPGHDGLGSMGQPAGSDDAAADDHRHAGEVEAPETEGEMHRHGGGGGGTPGADDAPENETETHAE